MVEPTRRAILRGAPALLGALAGCDALTGETVPNTTTTSDPAEGVQTRVAPNRTIVVQNQTGQDEFISVAVRRDGEVVDSTTVEVPLQTKRTYSLQARPGILDVELETTSGRHARHAWAVGDHMSELTITLTADDVRFSQSAWCTPQCDPLSKGGTSADFPYYGGPVFMTSYYGANVVIVNTTDRGIEATIAITHDGDSILDYAYLVPPGVTIEFPGVHSAGDYTVTVQSDVGDISYDWRPPKERRLQFRLTASGVHATCGQTTASFVLANRDTSVHQLRVAAYRPGRDLPAFNQTYVIQPGANYRERGVYTGSGQYELRISTGEGSRTTYDWWLCPPRGPTAITIQPDGELHVVQFQPGE